MSQNIARRMKKSLKAQTGKSQMNFLIRFASFCPELKLYLDVKSVRPSYILRKIHWNLVTGTSNFSRSRTTTIHSTLHTKTVCSLPLLFNSHFFGRGLVPPTLLGTLIMKFSSHSHTCRWKVEVNTLRVLLSNSVVTVETGNRLGDREATCHTQWFCSQLLLRHPEIWNNWLECLIVAALATEKLSLCGLAD